MTYEDPGCAYCPPTVRACRDGESDTRGPGFCPTKVDEKSLDRGWELYLDPEVRRIAQPSAATAFSRSRPYLPSLVTK